VSDDFFDKIDAKLGEQKTVKVAKDNASDANRAFVKKVIPQLVTIAESYAEKCRARGMTANVSHSDYSVTFELRYKGGQKRTVVGGPEHEMSNKLAFTSHWPNDDGKRYKSMPMDWFDEARWSDDRYEAELKKAIEDFVFYADRFGGI
jgi:hypothetical protein